MIACGRKRYHRIAHSISRISPIERCVPETDDLTPCPFVYLIIYMEAEKNTSSPDSGRYLCLHMFFQRRTYRQLQREE